VAIELVADSDESVGDGNLELKSGSFRDALDKRVPPLTGVLDEAGVNSTLHLIECRVFANLIDQRIDDVHRMHLGPSQEATRCA